MAADTGQDRFRGRNVLGRIQIKEELFGIWQMSELVKIYPSRLNCPKHTTQTEVIAFQCPPAGLCTRLDPIQPAERLS